MNKMTMLGRLTADPELRSTQTGVPVASFTLACQRRFKGKDGNYPTDFFSCAAWRQTGEFISKYFQKGQLMVAVGSMESRKYVDRDGNNRIQWDLIVDEAYFAGERSEASGMGKGPFSAPAADGGDFAKAPDVSFEEIDDGDLPF